MTLTELRKRLPGWEIGAIRNYLETGWNAWAAYTTWSWQFVNDPCWSMVFRAENHRTRKAAVAALAEKLEEIGVLK